MLLANSYKKESSLPKALARKSANDEPVVSALDNSYSHTSYIHNNQTLPSQQASAFYYYSYSTYYRYYGDYTKGVNGYYPFPSLAPVKLKTHTVLYID